MEVVNEIPVPKREKKDIREQIWDMLLSKGFRESSHSSRILKKEVTASVPARLGEADAIEKDGKPVRRVNIVVKYVFRKNNLQKFKGGFKAYSIPFCKLTIKDGKITKK